MFKQLDLFGNLPEPEKPANPPVKAEKRSNGKTAGVAASNQAVQIRMDMEQPETAFPETEYERSPEEDLSQAPDEASTTPASHNHPETLTGTTGNIPDRINPQNTPEDNENKSPSKLPSLATGPMQVTGRPATAYHPEAASDGQPRRFYIQTEIPSDPPLSEPPLPPELRYFSPNIQRVAPQEPKPRYIQTEIPSDASEISLPANPEIREEHVPAKGSEASPSSSDNLPMLTGQSEDPIHTSTSSEAVRRSGPLRPPKVILASEEASIADIREADKKSPSSANTQPPNPVAEAFSEQTTPPLPNVVAEVYPVNQKEDLAQDATPSDTMHFSVSRAEEAAVILKGHPLDISAVDIRDDNGALYSGEENIRKNNKGKRNAKEQSTDARPAGVPPDELLNKRQYYTIGEVSAMFGVKASLLRYWESEFEVLKLRKNRKGDRFFRPDDIRTLQLIHHLLRDKKYTIDGAREYMRSSKKLKEKFETIETLQRIRQFLVDMRNDLQVNQTEKEHQ